MRSGAIPDVEGSLLRDGFTFTGFGREGTDGSGNFTLSTVDPGPTQPGSAPFISLCVFARGLLNRLFTRIYLPEDEAALAADPLLSQLPADRRKTLIPRPARRTGASASTSASRATTRPCS